MKCDNCGEDICLGSEYYHYPFLGLYYHIDCEPTDSEMVKKELRCRNVMGRLEGYEAEEMGKWEKK